MQKLSANQKAIMIGFTLGLVVLLLVGGWYGWKSRQAKISTELSPRSQEFLDEHKGSVSETAVDFGDGKPFQNEYAVDGPCFSVVIPFASKKATTDEPATSCTVRLLTQDPTGRLVISSRPFTQKMADDPAIQLRRQVSFGYRESSVSAKKYTGIVRFEDKETVSVFWITAGKMMTIAFTGLADTTKVDTDRLVKLIESITLNAATTNIKKYDATPSATSSPSAGF